MHRLPILGLFCIAEVSFVLRRSLLSFCTLTAQVCTDSHLVNQGYHLFFSLSVLFYKKISSFWYRTNITDITCCNSAPILSFPVCVVCVCVYVVCVCVCMCVCMCVCVCLSVSVSVPDCQKESYARAHTHTHTQTHTRSLTQATGKQGYPKV